MYQRQGVYVDQHVMGLFEGILDEDEEGDTLINVNMIDDEHAAKNVENKKRKPDYRPYDEPEYDEYGMVGIWSCVLWYGIQVFIWHPSIAVGQQRRFWFD